MINIRRALDVCIFRATVDHHVFYTVSEGLWDEWKTSNWSELYSAWQQACYFTFTYFRFVCLSMTSTIVRKLTFHFFIFFYFFISMLSDITSEHELISWTFSWASRFTRDRQGATAPQWRHSSGPSCWGISAPRAAPHDDARAAANR